jgi:acetylornithine deacetylase/succinyl-diaminopimelate desuccinylase-like protein
MHSKNNGVKIKSRQSSTAGNTAIYMKLFENPEQILGDLIRFNTTNPPGNERECITYIAHLLDRAGVPYQIKARDASRPNLIARLTGRGDSRPLLLQGHVDVVSAARQAWRHPPFGGDIIDGCVWGRGALDMKGGVTMMLAALLRAASEDFQPAGDIVLAVLSDEETGSDFGAGFLVDHHPELFADIRYAIGEFGAAAMYIAGKKFYPVQVTEKQVCWTEAIVTGPGGHGSIPLKGGAMARAADLIRRLDRKTLKPHITPVARQMIGAIADNVPAGTGLILRRLLNPLMTGFIFKLLGKKAAGFFPLLYHTANPTIISGGDKINVIPSEIRISIDGRILPGFSPSEFLAELQTIAGRDIAFDIIRHDPGPGPPDMSMFGLLAGVLHDADPQGTPVPMLLPGVTDARHFARLGIQTYGFTPMNLPPDFNFFELVHAANERIPVDALRFGADALYGVLKRYSTTAV